MAWKLPWAGLEAELPKVKSWVLGTKIGQRGEQGAGADSVNGYLYNKLKNWGKFSHNFYLNTKRFS